MVSGPVRILIVDDDPITRQLTARPMRAAGYDVLEVGSGPEALSQARAYAPDLVLLDVEMPGMNGIEVCRTIKESPDLRDLFVVIFSGKRISPGDQTTGLEIGADGYIARPIAEEELLARVHAMLRIRAIQVNLRARTEQLEAIRAGTTDILRELDLPALLRLLVRRAATLVGVSSGTVLLWSQEEERLIPHASIGRGDWVAAIRPRLGEGVVGAAAESRRGMIVNDYQASPLADPSFLAHAAATAVIAEPLVCRDDLLGVITLSNEGVGRPFVEEDRQLLALFAGQVAIAIENARLYAEVRGHAAELERRVAARTAELGKALQVKGEFLSKVSHEFRTPLNFILGFADLLMGAVAGPLTPTQARYLDRIRAGGQRLLDLVNKLLDLTSSASSLEHFRPEEVPLRELAQEILDHLNPQIILRQIGVTLAIPVSFRIVADRVKLTQILRHLVSNAVKFTPSGGQVTLDACERCDGPSDGPGGEPRRNADLAAGRIAEISISDTGVGIAPEDLGRVFGVFEQADGSRERVYHGAGLGLTLVRMLVELHGGSVWAESQGVGTGARFIVRIPQGRAPAAQRILVVGVESTERSRIGALLGEAGYGVTMVGVAREALAVLRANPIDLVVFDLGLPDGSELNALRRVRAEPQTAALPVLVLTGQGEGGGEEAIRQGANEYLTRPVSASALLRVVTSLVREARVDGAARGRHAGSDASKGRR